MNQINNYFNSFSRIEKLMCLSLSAEISARKLKTFKKLFAESSAKELYDLSKIDEVDSHVAYLLKDSGIELDERWLNSLNSVAKRIDNLLNELDHVAEALHKRNIKIVALKNAGIARGIYQNSKCSPMGDIDLLVSKDDFTSAHQILINELGYIFKFRSEHENEDIEEAFRNGGTEYFKVVNGYTVWLELQWRPIAGRWIQPASEPNGDDLLKRSVVLYDTKVRILSPVDNLLQVCLHTAKHSYVRAPGFRLHSDVDRIVRFTKIDWDLFLEKVKKLQIKSAVYFSLLLPKELLETPIPTKILSKLQPNWLKQFVILKFISKAGVFNQKKKKFSKIGYIFFNMLLYDSFYLLMKSILPTPSQIKKQYEFSNNFLIPYFYLKRYNDLIFKRAKL